MQSMRSALIAGILLLAMVVAFVPASQAATYTSQLFLTSEPGGNVRIQFTATGVAPMTANIYRINSGIMPLLAQFNAGTLVAPNIPVTSGVPKNIINSPNEATNQGNGFLPGTTTVSGGQYWYLIRVYEPGPVTTNSIIRGAVADENPTATIIPGGLVVTPCGPGLNATSVVEFSFPNPFDEVVDAGANIGLNPGSVKQFAFPSSAYHFHYRLYRVAKAVPFNVITDPISGNDVTPASPTNEIYPYNRGAITVLTDTSAAPGTAYAYGLRLIDTVGNQNGGFPLTANQTFQAISAPVDATVTEKLTPCNAYNELTFTVDASSMPGGVYQVYVSTTGPVNSGNPGTALTPPGGLPVTQDSITYIHDSNSVVPRALGVTYWYAVRLQIPGPVLSCYSNSPSVFTTLFNPVPVVTLDPPTCTVVHGQVTVSGTATDATSEIMGVTVCVNTSTVPACVVASGTGTWTAVVPVDPALADSSVLSVTVSAFNDCGQIGTATTTFCVDNECVGLVTPMAFSPSGGIIGPGGLSFSGQIADDDFSTLCDAGINEVVITATATGVSYSYSPVVAPQTGVFVFSDNQLFGLADGQTTGLVLSATDGACEINNTCSFPIGSVTADFSAPVCAIIAPVSGSLGTAHLISVTAEDIGAAGIADLCVIISGPVSSVTCVGSATSYTSLFAPGVDGTYTIITQVTDTVGNTSTCGPVVVTIDVAPPIVNVTSPLPPNVGVNGSFLLQGTGQDLGSGVCEVTVEYTTSSGTSFVVATVIPPCALNVNWFVTIPVDPLLNDDDIFDVTVTAEDGSGNVGSTSESYFVDDTASCPILNNPVVGSTVIVGPGGLPVDWMGSDDDFPGPNDTGVSQVYASATTPSAVLFSSAPPQLGMASGTNTFMPGSGPGAPGQFFLDLDDGETDVINICLVDGATATQNVCCVTFEVIIDLTAPVCLLTSPANGTCFNFANTILGATDFVVTATDTVAGLAEIGINVSDASGVIATVTATASGIVDTAILNYGIALLPDGTYTITSSATDTVGNVAQCGSIVVTVDNDSPVAAILNPPQAVVNGTVEVSGSSSNATSLMLSYPGAGGGALSPLDATTTAMVSPTVVFDTSLHDMNSEVLVPFSLGFRFPLYGNCYDSAYISARGLLEFQNPTSPGANPTVPLVNSITPKVMGLWSAIDGSGDQGGSVTYRQYDDRFIVDFTNVPDETGSGSNTFSITLYETGAVSFIYAATPDVTFDYRSAVGISGGVYGQDVTGFVPEALVSNGADRLSIDLSAQAGFPGLAVTDRMAVYEIFELSTFDLGAGYNAQGSTVSTPVAVGLGGAWSATLPVTGLFATDGSAQDGDPYNIFITPFGGCNGNSVGDCFNMIYVIDQTVPQVDFVSASVPAYSCVSVIFDVTYEANDALFPNWRINSGINAVTAEVYQLGAFVANIPVVAVPPLPTVPNSGPVSLLISVDPNAIPGLQPGYFGIDVVAEDTAIDLPNINSWAGGAPPEVYFYDPLGPVSQPVCSRLFIAGVTEIAGASQTSIYELDPDTGVLRQEIALPAIMSSTLGCALGFNGQNLYYAPTRAASSGSVLYSFAAVTGPAPAIASVVLPVSQITGIGAEDDLVFVNGPVGQNFVYVLDASTLILQGTQTAYNVAPWTEIAGAEVGSGIFNRTYVARLVDPPGPTTMLDMFYETFPGGQLFMTFGTPNFRTTGLGFSGTRLFQGRLPDNVIREVVTTTPHAVYNSGFLLNSFGVPNGATVCAVAAGPMIGECTLCLNDLPANLATAVTDTAACGISQVDIYAMPYGATVPYLINSATTLPDLAVRPYVPTSPSAAVAYGQLTAASAAQFFPAGEGEILVYSQATDIAGNVESLGGALSRGITYRVDFREPRVVYLDTDPHATRGDYPNNVNVTLAIEDVALVTSTVSLTAQFSTLIGNVDVALPLVVSGTAVSGPNIVTTTFTTSFNPAGLVLSTTQSAYIDFLIAATDECQNTTSTVLIDRFIVDNATPEAQVPIPSYPACDVISTLPSFAGTIYWSMTNPLVWSENEMAGMNLWDATYVAQPTAGINAALPHYLAGSNNPPFFVEPRTRASDLLGPIAEPDIASSPSGIATVEVYYATGPASCTTVAGLSFIHLVSPIGVRTNVVEVQGGGYVPLSLPSATVEATPEFAWNTAILPPTILNASPINNYYYLKTIISDGAGNALDPIFGPFIVLDTLSPEKPIITCKPLIGTRDVYIDWERPPYDNVGVVGYEIWRTRHPVDDVLDANLSISSFDLIDDIPAYDANGLKYTEYLDQSRPAEGVYAYFIAAYDAAGNGKTGGAGLPPNRSNIVTAAPYDLIDPYPVTDLRVRAGEPQDGIRLSWGVPNKPGPDQLPGPFRPLGDDVAITEWEIFRAARQTPITQVDILDQDLDPTTNPIDEKVHMIARCHNMLVFDNYAQSSRVRLQLTEVLDEHATILPATVTSSASSATSYLLVFMEPLDVTKVTLASPQIPAHPDGPVTRIQNMTTGQTYKFVRKVKREGLSWVIEIEAPDAASLPKMNEEVHVDYLTEERTFVDTTAVPGYTFTYAVLARDAAGNRSILSLQPGPNSGIERTTVCLDTSAPEAIDSLLADADCGGVTVSWQVPPVDNTGVAGYDVYRREGLLPIDVLSPTDLIAQFQFAHQHITPATSPINVTLPAAFSPYLLKVYDTTTQKLLVQGVDYTLAGNLMTLTVQQTGDFYHGIDVVSFDPAYSLWNGYGFDGQLKYVDSSITEGAKYNYVVVPVDAWGNAACMSNNAFAVAADCTPPATPVVSVNSLCPGTQDEVLVTTLDPDVARVCVYDAAPPLGDVISCQEDLERDGSFRIPVGDNLFSGLWVVAIDFQGNTSPVSMAFNDVTPPAAAMAANVNVFMNPPGTDDALSVTTGDPDAVRVNVYRDDSLENLVDSAADGDDGFVDGVWNLNLGDNLSSTFFVTILDAACNESDDYAITNDVTGPWACTKVEVQNNTTGSGCMRVPVEDTLTLCVGPDVVMVDVFADASLLTPVTSAAVAVGPAGGCVGPIPIGNNASFIPGSLNGVYVVVEDSAGNMSQAVFAAIDISAPLISELSIFEQFPQQPGTFPRVEDEVDVQIDIDSANVDEVLCVKVFTESPTLNRESPFIIFGGQDAYGLAADATNNVLATIRTGLPGATDDVLVSVNLALVSTTLDSNLLNPSAIAVAGQGTGNIWVASEDPANPGNVRLSEITSAGSRVQDVDLAVPAYVSGMTFGATDILYFVSNGSSDIYAYDTALATLSTLATGVLVDARGIAFDGSSTLYVAHQSSPFDPESGEILAVDLSGSSSIFLDGLIEVGDIAIDRRGGIHYGESGIDIFGFQIIPERISEMRPGADGPLTLTQASQNEFGGTLVGPIITMDGRMISLVRESGAITSYTSNRRNVALVDPAIGAMIPPFARMLAERVPGDDFRVDGIRIGDNKVHEVQACVVDKAGNTSNIIESALNDVVGPPIYNSDTIENDPGTEDAVKGETEPFATVRAYVDPWLDNLIDRQHNEVRADRIGNFRFLAIGDNLYDIVFLAAEDEAGNIGQFSAAFNDVEAPDAPVVSEIDILSACPGSDDAVIGAPNSVEPDSDVDIYSDPYGGQLIASVVADASGAFGPVSIGDDLYDVVWIVNVDQAGNVSAPAVLDGFNGAPINDIVAPAAVNLENVHLNQLFSGEDILTGLPGATVPGDASLVRVYTDVNLTSELGGGLSPITVFSATGGWDGASLGINMIVNATLLGYDSLYLVAEDDACNQSTSVHIDLDRWVGVPLADKLVFNADDPNNNTIAGLEDAVGANDYIVFSTAVVSVPNSILAVPFLGTALSDEAGAFQAINVGRVNQPVSFAIAVDAHGNRSAIVPVNTNDNVAPAKPVRENIFLTERGRSFQDTIRGIRGAVGNGEEPLYLHAYADASLTIELPGFPILIPASGFNSNPAPGSFPETGIGENYANNQVFPHTVVGNPAVWLTAEDAFGNESEAVYLPLDVTIQNPDPTKIFVFAQNPQTDAFITGLNRAVEGQSRVQVSADVNNILLYGNFYSNADGAWDAANIGSLLRQPDVMSGSYNFPDRRDTVYVRSIDRAGNRSAVIPISIEIVTYAVMDAFGGITLRNGSQGLTDTLQPTFLPDGVARDLEPGFYRANGALDPGFAPGDPTVPEYTNSPTGFYRLTGQGQIAALGDVLPVDQSGFVPFTTDVAKDVEVAPLQAGPSVGLYMLDGFGGLTAFGGAPALTGVALGHDIARDFELDYNPDGSIKGGYILDGRGAMNPVGGSALIVPPAPFLIDQDIYVDAELVKNPADLSVLGAFVLSKFGLISTAGPLSASFINNTLKGVPNFGFNIARDLELSIDVNSGGVIGVYVLDGFGGIHAGGSAPKIHDAPFFGFDVARDLELLRNAPQD